MPLAFMQEDFLVQNNFLGFPLPHFILKNILHVQQRWLRLVSQSQFPVKLSSSVYFQWSAIYVFRRGTQLWFHRVVLCEKQTTRLRFDLLQIKQGSDVKCNCVESHVICSQTKLRIVLFGIFKFYVKNIEGNFKWFFLKALFVWWWFKKNSCNKERNDQQFDFKKSVSTPIFYLFIFHSFGYRT